MSTREAIFLLLTLFQVGVNTIGFAQIGPAGVGNADGTGGQPRNVLWLDASSITPDGSSNVTSWGDQSGNPGSLAFSNTANSPNPPEFIASGLNGLPIVRFDGDNSERLVLPNFTLMPTDEITTIIVMREESIEGSGSGILSYAVGTGG